MGVYLSPAPTPDTVAMAVMPSTVVDHAERVHAAAVMAGKYLVAIATITSTLATIYFLRKLIKTYNLVKKNDSERFRTFLKVDCMFFFK